MSTDSDQNPGDTCDRSHYIDDIGETAQHYQVHISTVNPLSVSYNYNPLSHFLLSFVFDQ